MSMLSKIKSTWSYDLQSTSHVKSKSQRILQLLVLGNLALSTPSEVSPWQFLTSRYVKLVKSLRTILRDSLVMLQLSIVSLVSPLSFSQRFSIPWSVILFPNSPPTHSSLKLGFLKMKSSSRLHYSGSVTEPEAGQAHVRHVRVPQIKFFYALETEFKGQSCISETLSNPKASSEIKDLELLEFAYRHQAVVLHPAATLEVESL